MDEELIDEVLNHPDCSFDDACAAFDFYINKVTQDTKKQVREDLKEAFYSQDLQ